MVVPVAAATYRAPGPRAINELYVCMYYSRQGGRGSLRKDTGVMN